MTTAEEHEQPRAVVNGKSKTCRITAKLLAGDTIFHGHSINFNMNGYKSRAKILE